MVTGSVPSRQPNFASQWVEVVAAWMGRATMLTMLVYAMWRYGAVQSIALRDISILMVIATGFALLKQWTGRRHAPLPLTVLAIAIAWVAYASLQSTALPARLTQSVGWSHPAFASDNLQTLSEVARAMPGASETPSRAELAYGSVIPRHTVRAIIPFLLVISTLIVSPLLFDSRRSRAVYLWTLALNASGLCIWGLIQRAGENHFILPGIAYDVDGVPFASFIYKNAGAAAILPALAMIAALMIFRGDSDGEPSRFNYSIKTNDYFSIRFLTLACLIILVSVGLITSLSRGAWAAGAIAAALLTVVIGKRDLRVSHFMIAAVACVAMVIVCVISGVLDDVWSRTETVSATQIANDLRWQHIGEGWRAAVANLPFGSGLGTYGYATLPFQHSAHTSWFQNAHNQYLETFTEMGVFGVSLIAIGLASLSVCGYRMIRNESDSQSQTWGLIVSATLIVGAIQSAFDFILIIPSNLILYASIVAIAVSVWKQSAPNRSSNASILTSKVAVAVILMAAIGSSALAFSYSERERITAQALDATKQLTSTDEPTHQQIKTAISTLDDAILLDPNHAELWERRALWYASAYRRDLIQLAATQGTTLAWNDSKLQTIYRLFIARVGDSRSKLRDEFLATPLLRQDLANCVRDFDESLHLHPLSPQNHLTVAMISPLVGTPTEPWTQSASQLVNSSDELLFTSGWIAFSNKEFDRAVDQWKKSLSVSLKFIDPIYELSTESISPQRIARDLIPPLRRDLFLRLVIQATPNSTDQPSPQIESLVNDLVAILREQSWERDDTRFETIARLYQLSGDHDSAVVAWKSAVSANGRNLNYRHQYALALHSAGELQAALDQASLAGSIDSGDQRFPTLVHQIRREIGGGRKVQ